MQYLIVGDLHGCFNKFKRLVGKAEEIFTDVKPFFVGDLLDRGPEIEQVIRYAIDKKPLSVMGNHDWKMYRWLSGANVRVEGYPGMDLTLAVLEEHPELREPLREYFSGLPMRTTLVGGGNSLHIVHAAAYPSDIEKDINKNSKARHLYGITTGKMDPETGYPERKEFADEWRNSPDFIVHGHVVVKDLAWRGEGNNVADLDTGAAFGGPLSGLLFPSMRFIQTD